MWFSSTPAGVYLALTVIYWNVFYVPSDVNECDDNLHHCTELCINIPGSYVCSCPDGFTLEEDGISCSGNAITVNI